MHEKAVAIAMVLLVVGVGIISIIDMSGQTTGGAVVQSKQCCCEIDHYDYYGNLDGKEVYPIQIRARNLQNCQAYCDRHLGNVRFRAISSAYPC